MITLIFNVLLFANPVFASAMNSSIVGLHDVLNKSFQSGAYTIQTNRHGCDNSEADNVTEQIARAMTDRVRLHTKGQCNIRPASPLQQELYSGVVAVNGTAIGGTGQIVYNNDLGIPESDTRFVLTALHNLRDKTPNKNLPAIDPNTGKINPELVKIHVRGCQTDQKVIAICTAPQDLKNDNNDYAFLVLEKSACQNRAQPLHLRPVEKQEAKNCKQVHVAQVLTPGKECGTVQNRNELSQYSATGPIAGRNLFFGDGQMESVNQNDDYMFYSSDTTHGGSGGGVFCDNGPYRGVLLGLHETESDDGKDNAALMIHNEMTQNFKKMCRPSSS